MKRLKLRLFIVILAIAFFGTGYWSCKSLNQAVGENKIIIAEGTQPIVAPVYVAFAKGYFKNEGITVELASFPTGKLCLDALLGGKADFATVAETPIMHASFKNQPMHIITTILRSRENTFAVARKDNGIKNVSDLKGKVIGVPLGTNAEYALSAFLGKHGISTGDTKLINLSPPEMIGPLMRGDLAAIAGWQPHIGRGEKSLGSNAIRFQFDEVYEETYNIVASTEMVQQKKDVSVKVLKALDRAIAYMSENPTDSIRIVSERIGMENNELEQLWPIYHFSLGLRRSLVDLLTAQGEWAIKSGYQNEKIPNMQNLISGDALRTIKPEAVELP